MESSSSPGGGRTSQGIEMFTGRGTKQYNYKFVIMILVIIGVLVAVVSIYYVNLSKRLPTTTIDDKTLPAGAVIETDYYTDELGWMQGQDHLVSELKNYYEATGVQPYLYITDTVDGSQNPSGGEVKAYVESLYDTLFTDQGHILLFYYRSDDQYLERKVLGEQAKTVVDPLTANKLLDIIAQRIKP